LGAMGWTPGKKKKLPHATSHPGDKKAPFWGTSATCLNAEKGGLRPKKKDERRGKKKKLRPGVEKR